MPDYTTQAAANVTKASYSVRLKDILDRINSIESNLQQFFDNIQGAPTQLSKDTGQINPSYSLTATIQHLEEGTHRLSQLSKQIIDTIV